MRRIAAIAIACSLTTLAAGCASSPPSRFYTLSAVPGPPATSSDLAVTVGPVSVPAAVDRPQIVVTVSANEVRLDETARWASPLEDNIARVVAENLVAMLGTPRVALSLQAASGSSDYRATIDVQRFDSVPGEAATLDAVWVVSRARSGKTETGRTTVREAVSESGYEALAAGHSRALARLSQDIAEAVRALERAGK
jgi:hypothetical protein